MFKKATRAYRKWLETNLDRALRVWPPYLASGIRPQQLPNGRGYRVEMRLKWFNSNYVGTHYGGSLYSMCDPFFMFILLEQLGPDYIVWDKAASIEFVRPGKGLVHAHFDIDDEELTRIRDAADTEWKVEPEFDVEVLDEAGDVVARVHKTLYVRRKDRNKDAA